MSEYPAPKYVSLTRPKSVEDLLPKARALVSEPSGHGTDALKPSYGFEAGSKVLWVILSEYDEMVVKAMCRAIREKGVHLDLLTVDSTPVAPPEELAAHEAIAMEKEDGEYDYYYTVVTDLIRSGTAKALVQIEKYDLVIGGSAGRWPAGFPVPWYRFNLTALEDWAGPLIDTPSDLQRLISNKLRQQLASSKVLRLTDPEGTDVTWTNYDDKRTHSYYHHTLARPMNIGHGFDGKDDCSGVVAGTLNHVGAFPHCKAHVERGQVVDVEGGGEYGKLWRDLVKKYKDVKLPPAPGDVGVPPYELAEPGLFWFMECAIGTIPGVTRLQREGLFQNFANFLHDRMRSGYIHNGFGPSPRSKWELIKAGLPWSHIHIHCVFPTLVGTDSHGEAVLIIDKGHLTALDDSEVRELASKIGNPDELLKETWWSGMPGVNMPGDYMKEYGQNPVAWIQKEAIEHPVFND